MKDPILSYPGFQLTTGDELPDVGPVGAELGARPLLASEGGLVCLEGRVETLERPQRGLDEFDVGRDPDLV